MTSMAPLTLPQDIQTLLDQAARRMGLPPHFALLILKQDSANGGESNVIPFRRTAR